MWMNVYLQDELIREKMADAEQRAARNQLLREMRQPGRFESALRLLFYVIRARVRGTYRGRDARRALRTVWRTRWREAEAREIAARSGRRPERRERHNAGKDTDHAPGNHPNSGTAVDVEWTDRAPDRRANSVPWRLTMWMNVYLQDELIREKMADAEQRAAQN